MSTRADPTNSLLVTVGGVGGFPQQGAVDWVAAASTIVGFSTDLLSRISRAGVEGLTLHTSLAIFHQAQLDSRGETRIQDALSQIGEFGTRNQFLAFGFGIKSIVRSLSESQAGLSCLGICGCLSEGFGTQTSAQILKAFCLLYNPPADNTPSLQQWYCLVNSCGGVFIGSDFGKVLSGITMHCSVPGHNDVRQVLDPSKIAEALKGVFEITRGILRSIRLGGGADCAWVLAIAHWLFGLSVSVERDNVQILHWPCTAESLSHTTSIAQVMWSLGSSSVTTAIAQKSYVIPAGQLISRMSREEDQRVTTHGRIEWSKCLVDTFGPPMTKLLHDHASQTGKCLGAAASIYEHVTCDVEISQTLRKGYGGSKPGASPFSYGRGFYTHAKVLLPELQQAPELLQNMESVLSMRAEEALRIFLDAINTIRYECRCAYCQHYQEPEKIRVSPDGAGPKYCLVYLVRTLLKIIHSMAYLAIPPGLQILPTVTGLKRMYDTIDIAKWSTRRQPDNSLLLDPGPWSDIIERLYSLFSAHKYRDYLVNRKCSAIAGDGICLYLNTLCDKSADPVSMCRFTIVPGTILWQGYTSYTEVEDVTTSQGEGAGPPWLAEKESSIMSYDGLSNSASPDLNADLVIIETTRSLVINASWLVSCSKGSVFAGPAVLAERMHYGFVGGSCYGVPCEPLNGVNTVLLIGEGKRAGSHYIRQRSRVPLIRLLTGDLAIWVSLIHAEPNGHHGFLQGQQCAFCTVKAAVNRTPFEKHDMPPISMLTWI